MIKLAKEHEINKYFEAQEIAKKKEMEIKEAKLKQHIEDVQWRIEEFDAQVKKGPESKDLEGLETFIEGLNKTE